MGMVITLPEGVLGATESLYCDGVTFTLTQLTGACTDVDDDPDSPDGLWLAATGNNVNTAVLASFPTPTGNPTVGADLQEFRALVRQEDETQSGTPQARIDLYESGVEIRQGTLENVPQGGVVISFTWNANELGTADGSAVEAYVYGAKSGGSPTSRNTVEPGAIEWNVDYTAGGNNAPTISNKITTDEGGHNISYSRSFSASDADSDSMTWSFVNNTTSGFIKLEYKGDGTQAWLNGTPDWTDREQDFYVNATVDDGNGGTDYVNYTLYINNTAPSISDKIATAEGGHNISFVQSFNASDSNSDNIDWDSWTTNSSFLSMQERADGSEVWLNGTPTFSDTDQYFWVNAVVSDTMDTDSSNFTLYINNTAPSISDKITDDTGTNGTFYERDFTASDANADTLTWSLTTNASFLNIGSSNGTVYGTPDATGEFWVNATVTDSMDSDYTNYTLTVSEPAPPSTDYFWCGSNCNAGGSWWKWDENDNWRTSLWAVPAPGEYPNANDDTASFNETADFLYLVHGANSVITIGALTTTTGFTGVITFSIDLIIDDAVAKNGSLNLKAGSIDVNTSNEQINMDGNLFISTSATFTERAGTVIVQGAGTQEIRVQDSNKLYQLTLDTASTVGELYDNLTVYKILIGAGTTYKMDADTRGYELWTNFSDIGGCGFVATSSGELSLTGASSGRGANITTADGSPPPTSYWLAVFDSGASFTFSYARMSYYVQFRTEGSIDIQNSTLSYGANLGIYFFTGTTITAFANNTVSDVLNFDGLQSRVDYANFRDITISSITRYDVVTVDCKMEFIDSSFDESTIYFAGTTGKVISKNHKVADAYKIALKATLSKSGITNDFVAGDKVTVISGTLTLDENANAYYFYIDSGAKVTHNTATTFDIDTNLTVNGTLESAGTITHNHYFNFYNNGGSIWLNNSTVSNADLAYHYGGFNFSVGKDANSTIYNWTFEAPAGIDTAFNVTYHNFTAKSSGVVWHMNVTAASGSVYFGTNNLTSGETYRSIIDSVQHTEGNADSGDYYNFSYAGWSTRHIYLIWGASGPVPDVPGPGQWDSWIVGFSYSKHPFTNEVKFTAIFNYDYNASIYIWTFGDGSVIETFTPNITRTFQWQLYSTESVRLTVIATDGMKYYIERDNVVLDNTLVVALICLGVISFAAVSILHSRRSRRREELIMVEREG